MELIIDLFLSHAKYFLFFNWFFLVRIIVISVVSVIFIITDLKYKKIIPLLAIIPAIVIWLCWLPINLHSFVMAGIGIMGMVIVYLGIYVISRKKIGLGDMLYMCLFASGFGWWFGLVAFLFSFWSATLILLIPIMMGRIKKGDRIPFIPFQVLGCVISILVAALTTFFS